MTRHGPDDRQRLVAGAMTGTSIDGIDVALVKISGEGLALRATLVAHHGRSLGDLAKPLRAAADQTPMTAGAFARLAWDLGRLHADVLAELVAGRGAIDLVAVHGQTVHHAPPVSWQLINPAPIERALGCPVLSTLRQADLAAGGQGAPITPLADWVLYRDERRRRAIVNLGGFCNATILPAAAANDVETRAGIAGFDVCACNHLLDAVARACLGAPYDAGGAAALAGAVREDLASSLRAMLTRQGEPDGARSLGTGDEMRVWVDEHRAALPPDDLAATVAAAIARTIASRLRPFAIDQTILAGGGAHNAALTAAICAAVGGPVIDSGETGIAAEAREAAAIAVLGALAADGVAITLPQVTGRA